MDGDRLTRRERDRAKRAAETKEEREARLCKRRETHRARRARDRENIERDHEKEVRLNNTSPFKHLLRLTPQRLAFMLAFSSIIIYYNVSKTYYA